MDDIKTLFRAASIATHRRGSTADGFWRELQSMLVQRCADDRAFYEHAKRDVRSALESAGVVVPPDLRLHLLIGSPSDRFLRLPPMHEDVQPFMRRPDGDHGGGGPVLDDTENGPIRDEDGTPVKAIRTVNVNIEHFYTGGLPIGKKGDDVWVAKARPGEVYLGASIQAGESVTNGARIDAVAGNKTTVHWWFNWCLSAQYIISFRFKNGNGIGSGQTLRVDHAPELFPPDLSALSAQGIFLSFQNVY